MLPRFVRVDPSERRSACATSPLEDLIANHLGDLFPGMEILDHHAFRLTRNEDVVIEEDETENLIQALETELLRRRFGPPIRLEVTDDMDDVTLDLLIRELDITEQEVYRLPGPLDLRGLFDLAKIDRPELHYRRTCRRPRCSFQPSEPNRRADIFKAIRGGRARAPPLRVVRDERAGLPRAGRRRPDVLAIKQTLYRTSGDSPIVQALIDAAESGKQVLALVEVKARFDEQANIAWARKLEKAGVHVVYGLVGLKTHCKLALVIREEKDGLRHYSHIGTGNYNPKTSRIYEDFGLFTDRRPGRQGPDAPLQRAVGLRDREEVQATARGSAAPAQGTAEAHRHRAPQRRGRQARGHPHQGQLDGRRADHRRALPGIKAGVPVEVWVRGICACKPGVEGLSENIRVRSILGRYLEHSRIFTFENDGDPQVFIGSADMMHRNLDRRVEALVRLVEPTHLTELSALFDQAMSDTTSSWHLAATATGPATPPMRSGHPLIDLQDRQMLEIGQRKRTGKRR